MPYWYNRYYASNITNSRKLHGESIDSFRTAASTWSSLYSHDGAVSCELPRWLHIYTKYAKHNTTTSTPTPTPARISYTTQLHTKITHCHSVSVNDVNGQCDTPHCNVYVGSTALLALARGIRIDRYVTLLTVHCFLSVSRDDLPTTSSQCRKFVLWSIGRPPTLAYRRSASKAMMLAQFCPSILMLRPEGIVFVYPQVGGARHWLSEWTSYDRVFAETRV